MAKADLGPLSAMDNMQLHGQRLTCRTCAKTQANESTWLDGMFTDHSSALRARCTWAGGDMFIADISDTKLT